MSVKAEDLVVVDVTVFNDVRVGSTMSRVAGIFLVERVYTELSNPNPIAVLLDSGGVRRAIPRSSLLLKIIPTDPAYPSLKGFFT